MERGPLRLQSSGGALRTGKREKEAKDKAQITGSKEQDEEEEEKRGLDKRTPAQVALEKMQEKQQMEGILKKASKTRKERVEEFRGAFGCSDRALQHPKGSWTQSTGAGHGSGAGFGLYRCKPGCSPSWHILECNFGAL